MNSVISTHISTSKNLFAFFLAKLNIGSFNEGKGRGEERKEEEERRRERRGGKGRDPLGNVQLPTVRHPSH